MKPLQIRSMTLGEGRERIISSIMDYEIQDILETMELVKTSHLDCIEWRGDWCKDVHDHEKMKDNLQKIRESLGDFPILFTFRSVGEGGHLDIPYNEYVQLNKALLSTGLLDLVDVELKIGDVLTKELIDYAHEHHVKVICSYHNFDETPDSKWMCDLMEHMRNLGADIPKCAVMAKNTGDLLKVLEATYEETKEANQGPVLTMAMGKAGTLSRISGEIFGSCLTFCSLKAASAPGQVTVADGYEIMEKLHKYC